MGGDGNPIITLQNFIRKEDQFADKIIVAFGSFHLKHECCKKEGQPT